MIENPQILQIEIDRLEEDAKLIHDQAMIPHWNGRLHGLSQTLYGYMMMTFSHIDRASAFFSGTAKTKGQTKRMVTFLDNYVYIDHEANSVAVQIWRHKLMHTARPRSLENLNTGKNYYWLLQLWVHLPRNQHYTFSETDKMRILNIGLVYLIEDLSKGIRAYLQDLTNSPNLEQKFKTVQQEYSNYTFEK